MFVVKHKVTGCQVTKDSKLRIHSLDNLESYIDGRFGNKLRRDVLLIFQ